MATLRHTRSLSRKVFDFLDKNDLVSAEESLRAAMRLEPGNPNNYALLMNLRDDTA